MLTKGTYVKWIDQGQERSGMVQESYPEKVNFVLIDGKLSRQGTQKDPVLFILDDEGNKYLRLESEVEKK